MGHPGELKFDERSNILLDEVNFVEDDWNRMVGKIMIPEGGCLQFLQRNHFPQASDQMLEEHDVIVKWENGLLPPFREGKMLLWNVQPWDFNNDFSWIFDEHSICIPIRQATSNIIHILELCAGGYGGWSVATRFLQSFAQQSFQTVALEEEIEAVQDFALTHGSRIIEAHGPIPHKCLNDDVTSTVLHGDLRSKHWWTAVGCWGVHIMVLSSPCQPWSGASFAKGLASENGLLLPHGILLTRIFRPRILLLEQVQNFASHPHRRACLNVLRMCGYQIKWSQILDAADFGGATRLRWLCLAVRNNDLSVHDVGFQMWPRIPKLTPRSIDALFRDRIPNIDQLELSTLMRNLAKESCLLPPAKKAKFSRSTGDEIFASRCYSDDQTCPTIMAMYGSQHRLSREIMETKGYLAHFMLVQDAPPRLLHPLEIHLIHLTFGIIYIDEDIDRAWRHAGNQITFPHALLLLTNALRFCDQKCRDIDIASMFMLAKEQCFQMKFLQSKWIDHGTLFWDNRFPIDEDFLQSISQNIQSLMDPSIGIRLPKGSFWTPFEGIHFFQEGEDRREFLSQITEVPVASSLDDIEATVSFTPMLKAQLQLDNDCFFFWVSADLSLNHIRAFFGNCIRLTEENPELGISFVFQIASDESEVERHTHEGVVGLIHDNMLILHDIRIIGNVEAMKQLYGDFNVLFDEFGPLQDFRPLKAGKVYFTEEIQHARALGKLAPCFFLAAFVQLDVSFIHHEKELKSVFQCEGNCMATLLVCEFWKNLFTPDMFSQLGMKVETHVENTIGRVAFHQIEGKALIPLPNRIRCMTVAAVRALLDQLVTSDGTLLEIKWQSSHLWAGKIDPLTNLQSILSLLTIGFLPTCGGRGIRLIILGKTWYNVTIQELSQHFVDNAITAHIGFELQGGAGTKDSQRIATRNAIAATFLEQGYQLEWVSKTTDAILQKLGLKKAMQAVQFPPGKQKLDAILAMCVEAEIEIPKKATQDAAKVVQVTPQSKQKKHLPVQPNPAHYTIEPGFLTNETGVALPQHQDVRAQQSGFVLMSEEQAQPWIREGQIITKDELAIVIIGQQSIQASLHHERVNVPCKDLNQRPVVLSCLLVQLGERKVVIRESKQQPIPAEECQTVSITMWKNDWSSTDWQNILDNTTRFVKSVLSKQGIEDALISTWGRSLRDGKSPTELQHASSVQIHATVKIKFLEPLLKASGFNLIFIVPKTPEGRIAYDWKLIWVDGNFAHLTSLAAKVPNSAGLVRVKERLGLRFHMNHFKEAWTKIFPDREPPSDLQINFMFRAEPFPFGSTVDMIATWARNEGWSIKPIKSLGPRAWLIGAKEHPPEGFHTFNGSPIIIRVLPPRQSMQTSPILAGPKPNKHFVTSNPRKSDLQDPFFDPWAGYQPTNATASTAVRSLPGPTEAKFQEQDQKITKLEEALVALKADTNKGFEKVEAREKKNEQKMQTAIEKIKTDIDKSVQSAIQQQSQTLDTTLKELRSLMLQKPKRNREEDVDEEM